MTNFNTNFLQFCNEPGVTQSYLSSDLFSNCKMRFLRWLLQRPKAYLSKNAKECTKCEKNRVLTYIACISLPPMPYDLAAATLTRNFSFPNLRKYSGCIFYYCFALSEVTGACKHVHTSVNTHVYTHKRDLELQSSLPWSLSIFQACYFITGIVDK